MIISQPAIIKISQLSLPVYLGIDDWEKTHLQLISIDLQLIFTFPDTHINNLTIENTLNYDEVCRHLQRYRRQRFDLIEVFAHTIIVNLMNQFQLIEQIKVVIHKPVVLDGRPSDVSFELVAEKGCHQ